ncbi:rhodanese-like domain-containing protein [Pontibacter liquoris]|uniref:rhodanese-like domain-containing protein n=1 Tax=Pontibacter liquoris TaxID=2905677 RepID=UPI001FA7C120|nr:rhodanese-like domain-containing protein [Pontibacter liquoris]
MKPNGQKQRILYALAGKLKAEMMNEITVQELKERLAHSSKLQLVDVREPAEFELCNLGGELIPLGELPRQANRVRHDIPVVVLCHHGFRSAQAIHYLSQRLGHENLLNLKGGIHAWATEIDPTMAQY